MAEVSQKAHVEASDRALGDSDKQGVSRKLACRARAGKSHDPSVAG